jgi:HEAT repeat protein
MDRAVVLLQLEARSKQPDIRANCVEALQPLSDDRSLDVIEQGLHDSDWVVRFASCMACGHRKVKTLLPVLQTMAVTDPNENVQVAAIYASARVGLSGYFRPRQHRIGAGLVGRQVGNTAVAVAGQRIRTARQI